MQAPKKDKLSQLTKTISNISTEVVFTNVLPALGVPQAAVRQAICDARLRLTSANIARILRPHIAEAMSPEQVALLLGKMSIFEVATSNSQVWHAVWLSGPVREPERTEVWCRELRGRVLRAVRDLAQRSSTSKVEVHTDAIGDLMFLRVQKVSAISQGSPLYVAVPPGQQVAFFTKLGGSMLQACVQGLGYAKYEDSRLHGRDLRSLLRIMDRTINFDSRQLTPVPVYDPQPIITKNCIDYTNEAYDEAYVENLIGPDPPLLNDLDVTRRIPFHDPTVLDKSMTVGLSIKSADMAQTLKRLVAIRAIKPTSGLITIFNQARSNRFEDELED